MDNPFLINTETIKENAFLHGNVEDKTISVALRRVQDTMLIGLIGSELFYRLLKGVNDSNLSQKEVTLLEGYIQPVLIAGVDLEIIDVLIFQSKNKGVVKLDDENVTPLTQNERVTITDKYKSYYTTYSNNLIGFLEANKTDYTEYKKYTTDKKNVIAQSTDSQDLQMYFV